jgi:uncharacterized iron-regulated membrane protein
MASQENVVANSEAAGGRRWPAHRAIWRWHFYAGLFCIPFVIWLASTGSIYLFKPQIDAWLDRPYDRLDLREAAQPPSAQVQAALTAIPGGVLNSYELPETPQSATRVLVGKNSELFRVYVHPATLQVLGTVAEDDRFTRKIFYLHGELMQGKRGSLIVETAASWTMVMLITGLFLWWPRGQATAAGVIYPRLGQGKRVFWRDIHAVTALWVSFFALFLLMSGLPWAKSWGGILKSVRQLSSNSIMQQDWTTGRESELAQRRLANAPDEHAGHHMGAGDAPTGSLDHSALDRLVPVVVALNLDAPVLISPPSKANSKWTGRSDTANRPKRVTLVLDGADGSIVSRQDFSQKSLLDRIIGTGIAAHEGQLFAPINQALGLFTALGLITVSSSAVVLWWRRRPEGIIGAPGALARPKLAAGVFVLIALIGLVLPMFGATLLTMLLVERLVLRRSPAARKFLGLHEATVGSA